MSLNQFVVDDYVPQQTHEKKMSDMGLMVVKVEPSAYYEKMVRQNEIIADGFSSVCNRVQYLESKLNLQRMENQTEEKMVHFYFIMKDYVTMLNDFSLTHITMKPLSEFYNRNTKPHVMQFDLLVHHLREICAQMNIASRRIQLTYEIKAHLWETAPPGEKNSKRDFDVTKEVDYLMKRPDLYKKSGKDLVNAFLQHQKNVFSFNQAAMEPFATAEKKLERALYDEYKNSTITFQQEQRYIDYHLNKLMNNTNSIEGKGWFR